MRAESMGWLLESSNPAVRLHALTDVIGKAPDDEEVVATRERILSYEPVRLIRRAQGKRGYWAPDHTCYNPKFTSTVWQLQLLGELGVPRTPWIESAVERFLDQHQMESGGFSSASRKEFERWLVRHPKGKRNEEPCLHGNMLRTLLVFGYGDDPRVKKAIDWMPEIQLKDGGWNCDFPDSNPTHSSFMSTVEPLWAYSEIPRSSWSRRTKAAVERGAEFLLYHHLYKSHHDRTPVELRGLDKYYAGELVTMFHFPMYYYYDALHALRVITSLGYQDDPRIQDAVHLVKSKMTPEGKWILEGDWARERKDKTRKTLVTLERIGGPSKWITLNCYRVLVRTGDLEL